MIRKLSAAVMAASLALSLGACSSDSDSSADGGSDSKGLTIGIKFDQPGLGLKKGSNYEGMDVSVAKYVAKKLGTEEKDIKWVQAPSAQRETLIETGQVDLIFATYSITDARKEKISFAGPYFIAGQDLLVRSDDDSVSGVDSLAGKKLCSVKGSTSAQKVKDKVPEANLQEFGTYSECVSALVSKAVDALTTDDVILAGYAAQEQFKGKLKVVGKPFSEENYGVGLKKGNTKLCKDVTAALEEMVADGSWKKAVDDNVGAAGFTPSSANPPKPAACE